MRTGNTPASRNTEGVYSATADLRPAPYRRGFTLVEMLMVIIIIGILLSLLGVAVSYAWNFARQARVMVEIGQLDQALQKYQTEVGEYPPCMGVNDATIRQNMFMAHLRRKFPRFVSDPNGGGRITYLLLQNYINSIYGTRCDLDNLDQAEALVFWLAGPPDPTFTTPDFNLVGFSANPANPFLPVTVSSSRIPPAFTFDPARLTDCDNDGWPEYVPQINTNASAKPPYVYYDAASTYARGMDDVANYPNIVVGTASALSRATALANEWLFIYPYASNLPTGEFVNAKKFQIICAGADTLYGGNYRRYLSDAGVFPTGSGFGSGELDNLTNFADGKLEDSLE